MVKVFQLSNMMWTWEVTAANGKIVTTPRRCWNRKEDAVKNLNSARKNILYEEVTVYYKDKDKNKKSNYE